MNEENFKKAIGKMTSTANLVENAIDQLIHCLDILKKDLNEMLSSYSQRMDQIEKEYLINLLNKSIASFELSVRTTNRLHEMNIRTISDLVLRTETDLKENKLLGKKSIIEIKLLLESLSLTLGMKSYLESRRIGFIPAELKKLKEGDIL